MYIRSSRFPRIPLTLAVVLLCALTSTAPAAVADTPRCVSHREHDGLRIGMPKWRVHQITDTTGVFWDGHAGGYTRRYRLCWRSDRLLYITYNALRSPHRVAEMGIFRR